MTEENALVSQDERSITNTTDISALLDAALPPVQSTDIMAEMVPMWDTSPFVILIQAQSPYTLPQPGKQRVNAGNFILRKSKTEFVDLGDSIDILVVDWRPKAMRVDKATNKIQFEFDRDSAAFQEIQEAAKNRNQGNFWGFEFLIYLGDYGEFANLFCNNPTLQNVARGELVHYLRKTTTLKSILLKKEATNFQWFAFSCSECTAPFQTPLDLEQLKAKAQMFRNPEAFVAETKEETPAADANTRER
jgi:hypothetical protein